MGSKLITVFGATGAQGGGLARAILDHPDAGFALRAVTRKPESDAAKTLAAAGAEIAVADLDDAAAVGKAMDGAYGAFCLTNFWEHFSPDKELVQAETMAEAARNAGLKHVIWSTLEDTRETVPVGSGRMPALMEKYNVPHLDAKGEANRFFTGRGLPVTLLHTSFYWDNFINFGMGPAAGPDGTLALTLPMGDAKLPGIAAEDIGRCAFGVFKAGPEHTKGVVGIAGEHLTGTEMADGLRPAAGQARALQRGHARGVPRLRLPRCRRPGQHVPVQARLQRAVLRAAGRGGEPAAEPGPDDVRALARGAPGRLRRGVTAA